jgi:hypothetical protein
MVVKKPQVNLDQMTLGASAVSDIYESMAQELMLRMIRRLKQRGSVDLKENPYIWNLQKLNDMHMLNAENIQFVAEQTGIAESQLREVIANEGLKVYKDTAQQLAEETGRPEPSYNGVKDTLDKFVQQSFKELGNYVNETLLSRNLGQNAAMRVYRQMIEQVTAEVATGLRAPDDAISHVSMKWLKAGIPSTFADKRGRTWSIESYARTVITSTTFRTFNQMRTQPAEEMGIDTFYMSAHPASRPACAPIQGHVVTKRRQGFDSGDPSIGRVESIYDHGYGTAGGTLGANCHHYLTPFVIGVNVLPDGEVPDPKEAIQNGREQAKQRAFERTIRSTKYEQAAAKALGNQKNDDELHERLTNLRSGLRDHIAKFPFLHRDYARERIVDELSIGRTRSGAVAGALNDHNDPYLEKRTAAADSYYRELRNSKREAMVSAMAKHSQLPTDTVTQALAHVLDSTYDLWEDGKIVHFDASYDMSQSLARLRSSNGSVFKHDITLLQHEALEARYMDSEGMSYKDAHLKANLRYNYQEELLSWKEAHGR